jgi:3-methyl-2-oxobutanoate hydroxymethyltransferase
MAKRISTRDIRLQKGERPIVCLTAYTAPTAKLLDAHVDLLLVGDTVGMVLYGMESTLAVDMDMMIRHGRAVVTSSNNACVVVDMPFGSYQVSPEEAFRNAAQILTETGAQAVKLEGGLEMVETIRFLVDRGIPVVGHIGLKPQSFNVYGGYLYQGRTEQERKQILEEAKAIDAAGAFAVVLECVEASLAKEITQSIDVPTIGIGASDACDGQVLVTEDMLGLFDEYTPKFVQKYGDVAGSIRQSVELYAQEVRQKKFPKKEHSYTA